MRIERRPYSIGLSVLLALAACGGQDRRAVTDTATTGTDDPSGTSASAAGVGVNASTQVAAGKTWDVMMIGDGTGYRFEPTTLTIKVGDAVRWTLVSGPPHNVTFWPDSIPEGAAPKLADNMPETITALTGPLRMNPNDTYSVSFGGVPAGTYAYYCTPHLALGMKAKITVQ